MIHFFLSFSTVLFPLLAFAAPAPAVQTASTAAMFTLGEVTSESSEKLSVITIKLDRPPEWKKVEMEDHGNFLQFSLPNTLVTDSGSFVVSHIPWIKTIGVFQSTPQTGMVRLFLSEDGAPMKKRLESEIIGNRILLTLNHQDIAPAKVAQIVPSSKPKNEISSDPEPVPSLGDPLKKMTWGLLFVLGLLFLALTVGRFIRTHRMTQTQGSILKMVTLADLALAPKQKLSLIQIGNEKFLFSVSPDRIQLITQLDVPPALAPQKMREEKRVESHNTQQFRSQDPEILSPVKRTPAANMIQETALKEEQTYAPLKRTSSISYTVDDNGISSNQKKDPSLEEISRLLKEKLRAFPKL